MSALKHSSFHIALLFVKSFFIFLGSDTTPRYLSDVLKYVLLGSGLGRSAGRQRGEEGGSSRR